MREMRYSLAIETSTRGGSVALGRDDELLQWQRLPEPRRHRVELMPAIEQLCAGHDVAPAQIAQVFVSIGPGSFTGLRIAVTTAKMLAMTTGAQIIAVPTTDVIAPRVDIDGERMAVCLSHKRGSVWAQPFVRADDGWAKQGDARLTTIEQLETDMTIVTDVEPQADDLWRLGRSGAYESVDPVVLLPIYARPPEAQEQWQQRYGKAATIQSREKT